MAESLSGVQMELEDGAYPLLKGTVEQFPTQIMIFPEIITSSDPLEAFKDADVLFLVGAMPRKEGMQRKDLLHANAAVFEAQGRAMQEAAKPTTKVDLEQRIHLHTAQISVSIFDHDKSSLFGITFSE